MDVSNLNKDECDELIVRLRNQLDALDRNLDPFEVQVQVLVKMGYSEQEIIDKLEK